jgi:polyisoprenoid-binding protein YceI
MTGRVLIPLLLASAGAHADKAWTFEPGQALVSVEMGPARARLSAASLGMSGRIRELSNGTMQAEIRVSLLSFTTGTPARDQQLRDASAAADFPEIVFKGAAPASDNQSTLQLEGTLTFHGKALPLSVPITLVRAAGMLFGHTTLILHLRDFDFAVPEGVSDELRVDVDAGLRPDTVLTARG